MEFSNLVALLERNSEDYKSEFENVAKCNNLLPEANGQFVFEVGQNCT